MAAEGGRKRGGVEARDQRSVSINTSPTGLITFPSLSVLFPREVRILSPQEIMISVLIQVSRNELKNQFSDASPLKKLPCCSERLGDESENWFLSPFRLALRLRSTNVHIIMIICMNDAADEDDRPSYYYNSIIVRVRRFVIMVH